MSPPAEIRRVAVLGAGTMGRGIAQACAQAGCRVRLRDLTQELLDDAVDAIDGTLQAGVERGKVTGDERAAALRRLTTTTNLEVAVRDADLVVEAVPEDPHLKREVLAAADAAAPDHAILASNTSSLRIAALADATERPHRVLGLHFFNPVHAMKLLEVIRADATSDATLEAAVAFAERLGKEPVVVGDAPGFATSRLGLALGLEAIRMVEQGVASPEAIDRAMELGYRHPMGPLRLTDLVGLDVRLHIAEYLHDELGETFRPPDLLRQMVADGKLGRKSGRGFYAWEDDA